MARQFPFSISSDQEMRNSLPQSQTFSASVLGSMIPRRQERALANKTDEDAIYELVSLGTHYSSSIVSFSDRLWSRTRTTEKFIEEINELQRLLLECNRKIVDLKQESKDLKSLLTASVRMPNPLDKDNMLFYEKQKQLRDEAKSLKFL